MHFNAETQRAQRRHFDAETRKKNAPKNGGMAA
jgi:hypothetical protein